MDPRCEFRNNIGLRIVRHLLGVHDDIKIVRFLEGPRQSSDEFIRSPQMGVGTCSHMSHDNSHEQIHTWRIPLTQRGMRTSDIGAASELPWLSGMHFRGIYHEIRELRRGINDQIVPVTTISMYHLLQLQ